MGGLTKRTIARRRKAGKRNGSARISNKKLATDAITRILEQSADLHTRNQERAATTVRKVLGS